jgi:hypothetical protein
METETEKEKLRIKSSKAYEYQLKATTNRLWIKEVFSFKAPFSITSDHYCVRGSGDYETQSIEFDWSPDSTKIVFAHSPNAELDAHYLDSSIAIVDIATKKVHDWKKKDLFEATPRFSPDGQLVAYCTGNTSTRFSIDRRVAVRSPAGEMLCYLAPTFNEGAFLAGATLLGWNPTGSHILFFEPKKTKYHLVYLPVDGTDPHALDTGSYLLDDPVLSYDRSHLGFILQSPSLPPEAFISPLKRFKAVQVSKLNQDLKAILT